MKQKKVNLHLVGAFQLCLMLLLFATLSGSAIAATQTAATGETTNALEISMQGYEPDKSEWSEKATAKYEKTKDRGGAPMAVLTIDGLNIKAPVYEGTHRITLDRGLGWIEGTAKPDEVGNIALSGHRDGFFRPLKDIKVGDPIEMQTMAGVQKFEVSDISIVDALEVSVLDPTDTTVLTLITCYPFYYQGYAPDRYIVRATPVGSPEMGSNQVP